MKNKKRFTSKVMKECQCRAIKPCYATWNAELMRKKNKVIRFISNDVKNEKCKATNLIVMLDPNCSRLYLIRVELLTYQLTQ